MALLAAAFTLLAAASKLYASTKQTDAQTAILFAVQSVDLFLLAWVIIGAGAVASLFIR